MTLKPKNRDRQNFTKEQWTIIADLRKRWVILSCLTGLVAWISTEWYTFRWTDLLDVCLFTVGDLITLGYVLWQFYKINQLDRQLRQSIEKSVKHASSDNRKHS